MKKTSVLLADDHTLIRAGLRMVVDAQPDLTVVGEANDGREAVAMAEKLKPDVVVMDIGMPSLNGIEASPPDSRGAAGYASCHAQHALRRRVRAPGTESGSQGLPAQGFRRSRPGARHPRRHCRESRSSVPAVGQVLLQDYMRTLQRTGGEDSYELLSPREREILQLVAEGKSSKEIANLLNLSVYTVETHRAKLMQKLNLRSVPEVILYAVRKGIIS